MVTRRAAQPERYEQMSWTTAEIGNDWDDRWDVLVRGAPGSGFMQASAWSAFKRAEGYTTPRIGLFEEGVLCGGAALLDFQVHGSEGFLICPDGPILPWHNAALARDGLRLIAREAEARASISGGLGLRIEPRVSPPETSNTPQLGSFARRPKPRALAGSRPRNFRRRAPRADAP